MGGLRWGSPAAVASRPLPQPPPPPTPSIERAALARPLGAAELAGGAVAAIDHVAAAIAGRAALDALGDAGRGHAVRGVAALAGAAAAAELARRAAAAVEQAAAAVA